MKKDIHPENYRLVVFKDMTNEYSFVTRSCAATTDTIPNTQSSPSVLHESNYHFDLNDEDDLSDFG